MGNLIAFINAFLSYGALFLFIVVLCVIAAFVGIKLRKNKNQKEAALSEAGNSNS